MRITDIEKDQIKKTIINVFGEKIKIILFGSRVDDNKKGGDIDLYIEPLNTDKDYYEKKIKVILILLV